MAVRFLNWMNWISWLGTVALILITVTGCDEAKSVDMDLTTASVNMAVNTAIESPVRNTCQSADLVPNFPKCH
jgi:hypothetical protein